MPTTGTYTAAPRQTPRRSPIGRTRWTDAWIDGPWPREPACSPEWRRSEGCRQSPKARAETTPAEASLYERLGGYFAIAAVVNRFSDEIIKNPKLNENPALKEWNETQAESRLPGLKFGRTLWVASVAGGPFEYTGLPLSEAHAELNLSAEEFAEVGAEIVRALDFYGVPQREQQELVEAYSASMTDVVTATE